ncbi:MAG: PLP-dependent aminotransferase family protein [Chloroflexota bacterium]
MSKTTIEAPIPPVRIDTTSPIPLYHQLYMSLRDAILSGQLTPGMRLPATRALASALQISRNTVVNAFDQLLAEGYLEGRVGDGTYVTRTLPDELLKVTQQPLVTTVEPTQDRRLSKRGELLARTTVTTEKQKGRSFAFRPGIPAFDAFPFDIWSRLAARRWRQPTGDLLNYSDAAGYRPLREAIATYLGAARGVRCVPEQVLIVSGSQQGIDLAARVLLDPDDAVWFEEPGYLGARAALIAAEAQLIPVPVDEEGLQITKGLACCPNARMAYVTPSHQFPLGVTMSLARRLALLKWARHTGAWVLEDDYDSEYRYAGRPLASLQGLDNTGRVIYLGTFSKVLFPSLRLGYLVVPPDLVDPFTAARAIADRQAPILDQAIVTDFIEEGHFTRHIRRMRTLYAERQSLLVDLAQRELAGRLTVQASDAGMHLVGWLKDGTNDQVVSEFAATHGVDSPGLSEYHLDSSEKSGILLGYTAVEEQDIRIGVQDLEKALSAVDRL